MSALIWTREQLVKLTESDDPEVRYWAVDRLVRHFPESSADAIAGLLLDDHDATPSLVARHLGQHGAAKHHAILVRGFRLLRGMTPGYCLQALASLGYPGIVGLANDALKRGDLGEPVLAIIVEAMAAGRSPESREAVLEVCERKPEILVEPPALRGLLEVARVDELPELLGRLLTTLERRGGHRGGDALRAVMDSLQIDDAAWCFRTGPSGHLELRKTIKAVESGYDCEIFATMGESIIKQMAQRFRAGNFDDVIRAVADWTREATLTMARDEGSDRPDRISAAVSALSSPQVLEDAARWGRQFQQWLLGFQLSTAFAVARHQGARPTLEQARGNLDRLLELAEIETAFHLDELPAAIAAVCRDDDRQARRAQEWCLRMLEAQGPFFPRVVALTTLGELRAVHFIPEVMEYLSDENSYVYGSAEAALSKMGEAIVSPAVAKMESGTLDPDATHSLLVLLCDLGTRSAYEAVVQRLDWIMDSVGPGTTAEWVSLFGTEELIEPLRDWLEDDPALVGQSLLLLGAIHDVEIPEEEEILQAIEDERARQAAAQEDDDPTGGSDREGGNYVM